MNPETVTDNPEQASREQLIVVADRVLAWGESEGLNWDDMKEVLAALCAPVHGVRRCARCKKRMVWDHDIKDYDACHECGWKVGQPAKKIST